MSDLAPFLTIRRTNNIVSLEWEGGLAPYRVQHRSSLSAAWQDIPANISVNYFHIPISGPSMFFRVRSSPDWYPPSVPAAVTGERIACDRAQISWGPSFDVPTTPGIRAYKIYRDGQNVSQVMAPALIFVDSGLNARSNYAYSVSAVDHAGNESARSWPFQVNASSDCMNPGDRNVTLAWDSTNDPAIAGYRLYHGLMSRTYTTSNTVWGGTSATVSNLQSGATYFFAVTAFDTFGLESDFSDEVPYTVP